MKIELNETVTVCINGSTFIVTKREAIKHGLKYKEMLLEDES